MERIDNGEKRVERLDEGENRVERLDCKYETHDGMFMVSQYSVSSDEAIHARPCKNDDSTRQK